MYKEWNLKDSTYSKDKGTVFSCFSGGGGSSLGYKLTGFNVIGCNEIDPQMIKCYIKNLKPKYPFHEPIQTFRRRKDLPKELYNLTILDGSPPCSSFTNAGKRAKDWGKEKKFREGQAEQVLDTLFFEFILLAKKLQPKIVIAENVPGITFGEAITYVQRIYRAFDEAGYFLHHWLLDASKMGVPQKRKRVFFIAMRKDLAEQFPVKLNMHSGLPYINLYFNKKPILVKDIFNKPDEEDEYVELTQTFKDRWVKTKPGYYVAKFQSGYAKVNPNAVCPVMNNGPYPLFHPYEMRSLGKKETLRVHSFPMDYNFLNEKTFHYIPLMSVPPYMIKGVAERIYEQWIIKLK